MPIRRHFDADAMVIGRTSQLLEHSHGTTIGKRAREHWTRLRTTEESLCPARVLGHDSRGTDLRSRLRSRPRGVSITVAKR